MGYHQQYYGDKTKPDPRVKYKSHGHFNRANYRFMTDEQFEDFIKNLKKIKNNY